MSWGLRYINWGLFTINFNSWISLTKMVIQPSSSRRKLKSKHYEFLPETYYIFFYDWNIMYFQVPNQSPQEVWKIYLHTTLTRFEMEESHWTEKTRRAWLAWGPMLRNPPLSLGEPLQSGSSPGNDCEGMCVHGNGRWEDCPVAGIGRSVKQHNNKHNTENGLLSNQHSSFETRENSERK